MYLYKPGLQFLVHYLRCDIHEPWVGFYFENKQENAMRYNNRDDLLQLSFILKISIFSEVYAKPSRTSMMEVLLQK